MPALSKKLCPLIMETCTSRQGGQVAAKAPTFQVKRCTAGLLNDLARKQCALDLNQAVELALTLPVRVQLICT